ncbi:class I SAM-dependent methyltransferase, partial [bacterium]
MPTSLASGGSGVPPWRENAVTPERRIRRPRQKVRRVRLTPASYTENVPKSTPAEIEARFDADVERFSDLAAGQATIPDSALAQDLLVAVAARHNARPRSLLDLGCGAGNLALRLLMAFDTPPARVRLIDLSGPMLVRAEERIRATGFAGDLEAVQGDLREVDLGGGHDV